MKIKLSKAQWQEIGEKTGWLNKKALFGPNFAEFYGSESWKSQFGKPITTNILIDNSPLVMSTQMGDDSQVVVIEHNGEHIGVYDPKRNGFDVTYTKNIEKYSPFKTKIDEEAKKILETQPKQEVQAKTKNIKTIKIAQAHLLDNKKAEVIQKIFDAIPGNEGKDTITGKTTSKEIMDEAMGTKYIQAYYREESIWVERYYDSEYLDQEYHKTIKIPINWNNPKETSNAVIQTMNKLKTRD